jgi:hypothetical protein
MRASDDSAGQLDADAVSVRRVRNLAAAKAQGKRSKQRKRRH